MKKYIPLAVLAVFLMAPLAPQAEARSNGEGFFSGLFDKKTKKRANKRIKRSRKHLAKKGFDPLMGARPMQRLIQDTIRKALADELLFGKLVNGGKVTVDHDLENDQVSLTFDEGSSGQESESGTEVAVD